MSVLVRRVSITFAILVVMAMLAAPARAGGSFTVNTTADQMDANVGDGICATASGNGVCSLRAAVMEADRLGGINLIHVPAGVYNLSISTGTEEQDPQAGDLDLAGDVTIIGAAASQTIIDSHLADDRAFHVLFRARVAISGITIRNGRPSLGSLR